MTGKREWITPKLIVLGRGTPEENVLQFCKTQGPGQMGPGGTIDRCRIINCRELTQGLS
jgi:hypothetical protein